MANRKVYITAKISLDIRRHKSVTVDEAMAECDYWFKSTTQGADIEDTELRGWEEMEDTNRKTGKDHIRGKAEVDAKLIIRADEGVNIDEVMQEVDYGFQSLLGGASVKGMEILEWEITDSK